MEINSGYLEIIIGPMFSGKTTEMLRKLSSYADTDYNVLLINHSHDTRPGPGTDDRQGMISSHSSQFLGISKKLNVVKTNNLNIDVNEYDVIGIDEVQFFEDLNPILNFVEIKNKIVYVCGLDGDYKRHAIGNVFSLIPMCDKITKLNARCKDCIKIYGKNIKVNEALFTHRTIKNESQILIGAKDSYESLCRYHYLKKTEIKH